MIEPTFLELTPSSASVKPDSCGNYDNSLSENHHQSMINYHDLDQKNYADKVIENNSSPSFPEPLPTAEVKNGYLDSASNVTEPNITSPSGLVTPPILPGTTTTTTSDNQRTLLENVASRLATSVDQVDGVPSDKQEPEFPPSRFELPKELFTPTIPEKSIDHDTPSTVSPPASLPVATTTATSCAPSAVKREEENALSPVFDDAEYAAAAIAAVDSVVSALVGNKAPSTTAPYDPALIGTGTDRLYSLSLAPVGKTEAVSLVDSRISTTTSSVPACTHAVLQASLIQASAEGVNSLSCPNCGAVVSVQQLLLQRQRSAAEAKHVCEACGKCFVREDKLKRHIMSIHTQEKPHVCSICTKAFARKDKLKDHLRHHDRAARTFECSQCLSPFVQKSDLNRHVRGVHQGEPGVGINMTVRRRMPGKKSDLSSNVFDKLCTSPASSRPSKKKKKTISNTSTTCTTTATNATPQTTSTTVSMAVTNSANTDAALALRLFGNTAANTAAVNIQTGVQQVQQVAAYPQHQLLAAASMVLPYYHPTPAGHQFVAAALSAQKSAEGQTVGTEQHQSAFQQPSQQQQNSATAAAAPSMMFLTRIAAHAASNQSATATTLAVLPTATAAVVTPAVGQQCETSSQSTATVTSQADQQQQALVQQQQQYQQSQFAYQQYQQQLLQHQAQLQAHHYDLNTYYRQQQLAAQQRVYQQAQGFLLAATANSNNGNNAPTAANTGTTFFCQSATVGTGTAGNENGTGVILSDPTTAQQLAQLAAAAQMQQAVAARGGLQVMANVIAGQQQQQQQGTQQTQHPTVAAHQQMAQPQTAFYAAYQHPAYQQQSVVQQQQQYQAQQQLYQQQQHQLMLQQSNTTANATAATTYRPVVMTAATSVTSPNTNQDQQQKTTVVHDPTYQQQLAAFYHQQRQGFVLAYQQQNQCQQQQQTMQQQTLAVAGTAVEPAQQQR